MRHKVKKARMWPNKKKFGKHEFHFVQQSETKAKAKKTAERIRKRHPSKKVRVSSSLWKRQHAYGRPTRHAIYEY